MHPLAPILCAALPGAICAVAHYIPWRHWFRRGRLPRPWAYAVGLLSVLLPATVAAWLAALSVPDVLALLWLAAGSAGVGTLAPWWLDGEKRARYAAQDAADAAAAGSVWGDYAE